ncbi:LysR family transcriptional regulator, glycine cleavage system transcriptional activator [Palleronia salina]|uniref:LysR family transcriptional regulator, glycine cleavage system transcriptional activator n=1 Tax=Palleronia salina TaxID=313368 RepID=A0A1M6L513_9RHOB|nr:LysR substrate-binding domain-containing protein [Palleronia salina]SHJ66307.1 LysR family transcriptional regulator, glycine cleavage system transcriptional activator [Palleronia salina]
MGRRLPPFAAIRAFEAAARHLSFAKAADELCLSPSAISHQIRALEDFLDTKLFERRANQTHLTLTGRGYARRMTTLLDRLEADTASILTRADRTLRVLCTPGFAARWLVPRLDRFEHPEAVRLRVSTGAPSTDFASNDADVVIGWTEPTVPDADVVPLMRSGRYPVASPSFLAANPLNRPEDLCNVTLMHDETMDQWDEWFAAAGVAAPRLPRGPAFPNCELATSGVEQGLGVSLGYDMMVRDTIKAGRLVRLFDTVTMPFVIYSFICQSHRADEPMIAAFRAFLTREMRASGDAAFELVAE